jgi:hypothetical protein
LVSHAVEAYPGEIAIIAYYGSYAQERASATSDLDLYYVPDPGAARSLSSQFVIDGLPYDLWPVSWRFLEEIADARGSRPWGVAASLVADARVLYYRSPEDLARFDGLKARLAELLRPESRPTMVGRALDAFKTVGFQLDQLRGAVREGDLAGRGWAGWQFAYSVLNCLSLLNQTTSNRGWGANLPAVMAMETRPERLDQRIEEIVMPADPGRVLPAAEALAQEVGDLLRRAQASLAEPAAPGEIFADFYFYVVEYRVKVLSACARGDRVAAGCAATHMQQQIAEFMFRVEGGFYPADLNLFGEYVGPYLDAGFPDLLEPAARGDLAALAARVVELDERMQAWLEAHSVGLNVLADVDELRRFLRERIDR